MMPISKGELRESLGARPDVQRLLGRFYFLLARWDRLRDRRNVALRHALESWRWLGNEAIGARRDEIRDWIRDAGLGCGDLRPLAQNPLRRDFLQTEQARIWLERLRSVPVTCRVRMRRYNVGDPRLPGNLILLKEPQGEEKGVVLIKYTTGIEAASALFDLPAMAERYVFVLEPSSWGYQDAAYLMYAGSDIDVIIQSPASEDFDFILDLQSNLYPVRIGAGDWVKPALFESRQEKTYDLIAVSGWNPLKRHRDLFEALRSLRRRHHLSLNVALVGYPQGWTREDILRLIKKYGLEETCTIYERLPYAEVAQLLARSRAYVLMSRREGANKAMYESLFSDVPVVVYRHHRGINLEHVNEQTGVSYGKDGLADAIMDVLHNGRQFRPRQWADEHTGCHRSSEKLGAALRQLALRAGLRWTRDIVPKANTPNLRYVSALEVDRFAEAYDDLAQYLRLE